MAYRTRRSTRRTARSTYRPARRRTSRRRTSRARSPQKIVIQVVGGAGGMVPIGAGATAGSKAVRVQRARF